MSNWYDDIDVATLQRIKTYSAFCDYKSQNLMLQTLYEAMQKKIDEYKQTNRGIAKDYADLQKQVKELQQENAELRDDNKVMADNYSKMEQKFYDNLTKAKENINDLVHLGEFNEYTDEEYLNSQVHEALKNTEQFLKE